MIISSEKPEPINLVGFEGAWEHRSGKPHHTLVGSGAAVLTQGATLINPVTGERVLGGAYRLADYVEQGMIWCLKEPMPITPDVAAQPLHVLVFGRVAQWILFPERITPGKASEEFSALFPSLEYATRWGQRKIEEVILPKIKEASEPHTVLELLRIGGTLYAPDPRLAALRVVYRRNGEPVERSIHFNSLWSENRANPWTAEDRAAYRNVLVEHGLGQHVRGLVAELGLKPDGEPR